MSRVSAIILSGSLLVVPTALAAGQSSNASKAPSTQSKPAKPAPPATHATTGIVKSIDATSVVVSKPGNKDPKKDMTFQITASTEKKGDLAVGSPVQVRYKTENGQNVATAVSVQKKG
jgi:Domain of unknown function (DUF5666)